MKGFTGIRAKCTAQCNEPDPANDGICNADVYPHHQKLPLFPFGSTSDHVRRHAARVAELKSDWCAKAHLGRDLDEKRQIHCRQRWRRRWVSEFVRQPLKDRSRNQRAGVNNN
jgi:hypothetical protein